MPWFRVDDTFHSHPKVLAAGNAACGLYTRCGSYCGQHLTDGHIPAAIARAYGTRKEIAALIAVGLWIAVDGGYRMPDYLDYNWSAAKVKADRSDAAERQRKRRESQRDGPGESQRDNADGHGVTHGKRPGIQAKPSQASCISSEHAAAATELSEAAAAAIELFIAHRLATEPDVRSPRRYADSIRRDELAAHASELSAITTGTNPIEAAITVFGLTRSQAMAADHDRRRNGDTR